MKTVSVTAERHCSEQKAKWLNAEYKPKREFSEEDKAVVRALDKAEWWTRDKDGTLYCWEGKPIKAFIEWKCGGDCINLATIKGFTSAEFLPISWDDKKPTRRAEILGEK